MAESEYRMYLVYIWSLIGLISGAEAVSVVIPGLGTCQGLKETLLSKSVDVFKGIPYAKPPIGKLRFKAPEPISWTGILNATKFGGICPQQGVLNPLNTTGVEEEDCLTLNIYKPSTVSGKLPVMFWIHGGGYSTGSGPFYDGRVLAAEYGVVVVTINYRLGILGFFNVPGTETKGNYGMLDQIAALRWVKKNIASFGGDPGKVTIFGESAGAGSVSLLTVSPLTRNENLFKRAISESGVASCSWAAYKVKTNEVARKFGASLGCSDVKEMTECLRGKTVAQIMSVQKKLVGVAANAQIVAPVVDGYFLKDLPWDLERTNTLHASAVEQMIGYNSDEGTMFGTMVGSKMAAVLPNKVSKTHFQNVFRYDTAERYPGKQDLFHQVGVHEYTRYSSNSSLKWFESVSDFRSDYYFVNCAKSFSDALANSGKTVYRYKFTYMPKKPLSPHLGVAHAMEIAYVLGWPLSGVKGFLHANYTDEDKVVSRKVMKLWTDFAKNGNPGNQWPKYTMGKKEYMNIGLNLTVERDFETRRMAFWNSIVPQLTKTSDPCKKVSSDPGIKSLQALIALSVVFAVHLLSCN